MNIDILFEPRGYACSWENFGKTADITRKQIRAYLVDLGARELGRTSVIRKRASLRSLCAWLAQEGFVGTNPGEGIAGPRRHQELPDVPSEANMGRLLNGKIPTACPTRDRLVLELLYCGLRASELTGVNVEDFPDKQTLLVRGKGRRERLVPLGRYAQRAVARWLTLRLKLLAEMHITTNALLFSVGPRRSCERLDVRSVGRIVKQVAIAKHLPPYHPHQLRHACATHMHDHGAPIQVVATMLGHVRLSTTQIYTRVSSGRMMDVYTHTHPHSQDNHRKSLDTKADARVYSFPRGQGSPNVNNL